MAERSQDLMQPSNRSSAGPHLAYSLEEASELTALSVRSLRYLVRGGRLGYVRLGRRVLIPHASLEVLLKQHYCRPCTPLDAEAPIRPRKASSGHDNETANSKAPIEEPGPFG